DATRIEHNPGLTWCVSSTVRNVNMSKNIADRIPAERGAGGQQDLGSPLSQIGAACAHNGGSCLPMASHSGNLTENLMGPTECEPTSGSCRSPSGRHC